MRSSRSLTMKVMWLMPFMDANADKAQPRSGSA